MRQRVPFRHRVPIDTFGLSSGLQVLSSVTCADRGVDKFAWSVAWYGCCAR